MSGSIDNAGENKTAEIFRESVGRDFPVKNNPCQADMLDTAQDALPDRLRGNIISNFTALFSFFNNVEQDIAVVFDQPICITVEEILVIPHLQKENPCEYSVCGIHVKVGPDQFPDPVNRSLDATKVVDGAAVILPHELTEYLVQQIALIFEIFVYQCLCDTGVACNFRGGNCIEFFLFEQCRQGLDDFNPTRRMRFPGFLGHEWFVCYDSCFYCIE